MAARRVRPAVRLRRVAASTGPSCLAVSQLSSDAIERTRPAVLPLTGGGAGAAGGAADVGSPSRRIPDNRPDVVFTSTHSENRRGRARAADSNAGADERGINGISPQIKRLKVADF